MQKHPVREFSVRKQEPAIGPDERPVAVVVEQYLAGPLSAELEQFASDLRARAMIRSDTMSAAARPRN